MTVEESTLAFTAASYEMSSEVAATAHQHNKTTLERLCSTVSALVGFYCMVGERMKSLLPYVSSFSTSLSHAALSRTSQIRLEERRTKDALQAVQSKFGLERQFSIEHGNTEQTDMESVLSAVSTEERDTSGYVFKNMSRRRGKTNWCLVWVVLDKGTDTVRATV